MGYRMLDDLTSDVMFEATGKDLNELFSSAAQGLFSIICDRKNVRPASKRGIHVAGKDLRETMINFLQALIALVDTEEMFFSKFVITSAEETEIVAEAYGEPFRPDLAGTVVKAVTYYNFSVEKTQKGWRCKVVVDV